MKSVLEFQQKKHLKKKITMITCYDYTSASIISKTNIDCVLVGDSGSMVMLGKKNTTLATLADMRFMTQAVAKGLEDRVIITDLPFMSYRQSISKTMQNVMTLIQAGAHAVKLEGAENTIESIQYVISSGIPVMGHIGLTPQFIHSLGGFKVQGKTQHAANRLLEDAKKLSEAGCFAVVLECVPWHVAKMITQKISIPTIGIGAGAQTSGQVLVFQDLLGLYKDLTPRFVKKYLNGKKLFTDAINQFVEEVIKEDFPQKQHSYTGDFI